MIQRRSGGLLPDDDRSFNALADSSPAQTLGEAGAPSPALNDTEPETLAGYAKTLPRVLRGFPTCTLLSEDKELFMLTELWAASLAEWLAERNAGRDVGAEDSVRALSLLYGHVLTPRNLHVREERVYVTQFRAAFWRTVYAEVKRTNEEGVTR